MLRDMMKGHTIVEYKWVVLARITALGFVLVTGLGLVYSVTIEGKPASADKTVPVSQNMAELRNVTIRPAGWKRNKAIKTAVLKWMRKNSDMPDKMLSRIYDSALKSGNPDLVLAVCVVESNFNPTARSDKGALGLMGVMPSVWLKELKAKGIVKKRRDLYKVGRNIASGSYVLGRYVERTGNIEDALTGYVGGDPSYARKVLHELGEIYLVRRSALKDKVT